MVAPRRAFGSPVADLAGPIPYPARQALLGVEFPYGRLNYWKASLTRRLTDEAIETIVHYAARVPSPFTATLLAGNLGPYTRVAQTAIAYYHRDAPYNLMMLSSGCQLMLQEQPPWLCLNSLGSPHFLPRLDLPSLRDRRRNYYLQLHLQEREKTV